MSVTDNYDDPQPVATVQMQHVNMYFSNCVIQEANISLERKEKKKKSQAARLSSCHNCAPLGMVVLGLH